MHEVTHTYCLFEILRRIRPSFDILYCCLDKVFKSIEFSIFCRVHIVFVYFVVHNNNFSEVMFSSYRTANIENGQ